MKAIKSMMLLLAVALMLLCGCNGNDIPDGGEIIVRKGLLGEFKIPSEIMDSQKFKDGYINIYSMTTNANIFKYSAKFSEQSNPADFQVVCDEFDYDDDVMFACGNYTKPMPYPALGGEFHQISLKSLSDFNNEIGKGMEMSNYSTLYALTAADVMQDSENWPIIQSTEDNKLYGRRIPFLADFPVAKPIAWSETATIALPLELYIHINAKPAKSGKYSFELSMIFSNSISGKYVLKSPITVEWE